MKTRLIVMVVVALLLANQTTVDVENQPKIIMENEIENMVVETENYDEIESENEEENENVISKENAKQDNTPSTSSAPITQEVRQVDSAVGKQVVTEDGSKDGTGVDDTTTQPTSKGNLVYVEGFGYVEDSGPAQSKTVHSDGDINKMVGTMD